MSFTPSALTFLIVCPLVFLGGFVDAVAGGGGLISLPAYMIAGLPVHSAIATNKLSSAMGTSVATFRLAKARYIPWKKAVFCIIAALIGSNIGAHLALMVDAELFKRLMLVILPLTALYLLRTRSLEDVGEEYPVTKTVLLASGIALVIGMYDGFYGPGTGTFLMLLLTALARQTLRQAAGTTKAVNLATNFASLSVFLWHGAALIPLGLVAGLFSIAGNWLGARFFTEKGSRIVRPIMLVVIALFALRLVVDIGRALIG